MASRKHSRNKRKRKRSQSQSTSPGDLLAEARQLLARGDGRGALDRLRQAQHADAAPEDLPLLLFCACIQRARQLARSGLDKEAAAMRARAEGHRPSIPVRTLPEEDLARYLQHLDGTDALAVYADCLGVRPPIPRVERALADRLVIERDRDGLEALDVSHPLRRDAGPVMRGVEAMDAGDWERAADHLRPVSRRSPFAPWRVFCKAMTCFGAGDDQGLGRSLDLLPADFALAGTVAEWRRIRTGEGDGDGGSTRVQAVLGTGGTAAGALGDELRLALRGNRRPRVIERLMINLADALYPDDPLLARIDLLRIAGLATLRSELSCAPSRGWGGVCCRPSGRPACWPGSSCCASRRHGISGTPLRPPPFCVICPWSSPEPPTGPWPEAACSRPWPASAIGPSSPGTCRPGWTRRCPACWTGGAKIPGCCSPT